MIVVDRAVLSTFAVPLMDVATIENRGYFFKISHRLTTRRLYTLSLHKYLKHYALQRLRTRLATLVVHTRTTFMNTTTR